MGSCHEGRHVRSDFWQNPRPRNEGIVVLVRTLRTRMTHCPRIAIVYCEYLVYLYRTG